MSFNYAQAAATAERLIAFFGADATLQQYVSSGSEFSPTVTPSAPVTIKAARLDQRVRDMSGGLVGMTVKTLYISTSAGVTPTKGDKVVFDGITHEIDEVMPLAPAGINVFWKAELVG